MRDVSSYIPTPLVLQNYFTKSAYIINISIIKIFLFCFTQLLIGRIVYEKVETQKAGAGMNNKGIDSGYLLAKSSNIFDCLLVHLFICSLALTLNQLRPSITAVGQVSIFFFFFLSTD